MSDLPLWEGARMVRDIRDAMKVAGATTDEVNEATMAWRTLVCRDLLDLPVATRAVN